jgi:quercetin dioxygenase-like cupin family protein
MTRRIAAGATLLVLFTTATLAAAPEIRLTPGEIGTQAGHNAGAGTSGIAGIRTTVLAGDPTKVGLYTIRLNVPAHTQIAAHSHRDDRTAVVISGTWYFGYGPTSSDSAKKALPQGSFYSEPGGVAHFAETKDEAVVVYITGYGPTDTTYINPAEDPRRNNSVR